MNKKIDWYAIIIGFCTMGVFIFWNSCPRIVTILAIVGALTMMFRKLCSKFKQRG